MPTQQEILFEQMSRRQYETDYDMYGSQTSPTSASSPSSRAALSQNAAPIIPLSGNLLSQQQLQQQQQQQQQLTVVNGIGLWNSWTRNFSTPLLAMLDLLDNAFDAAFLSREQQLIHPNFRGRIHIMGDTYRVPSDQQHHHRHHHQQARTTGLRVINNCARRIKPLSEVLEVYRSAKGSAADSIGENGVGLKQGCATLSDLSFVLTRNGRKLSLGIIAFSLQKPEGCYLPSVEFDQLDMDGVRQEMEYVFTTTERPAGECVADYGEGCLFTGINRLVWHYETMQNEIWGEYDYVFCLVIHKLKHGNKLVGYKKDQDVEGQDDVLEDQHDISSGRQNADEADYKDRAFSLMENLRRELPIQYIHIPADFDVQVNHTPVQFNHWHRRLVELTRFEVMIDTQHPYMVADDWRDPFHAYPIRIFVGFDAIRAAAEGTKKSARLFVYSRQSGRLIKYNSDARGELGLGSGGTMFCQGLTVIVDDFHGNLPLNPTKQDVAFGEQANGETHKTNLMAWIGAVAHIYYMYHLDKYKGRKTELSEHVKRHAETMESIQRRIANSSLRVPDLAGSNFTVFKNLNWYKTHQHTIRIKNKTSFTEEVGSDTLIRLERPDPDHEPLSSYVRRKRKTAYRKAQIGAAVNDEQQGDKDEESTVEDGNGQQKMPHEESLDSSRIPRKKKKTARKSTSTPPISVGEAVLGSDEEGGDVDDIEAVISSASKLTGTPGSSSNRFNRFSKTPLAGDTNEVKELERRVQGLADQLEKEREQHKKNMEEKERAENELQERNKKLLEDLENEKKRNHSPVSKNGQAGGDLTARYVHKIKEMRKALALSEKHVAQLREKAELADKERKTLEETVEQLRSQLNARAGTGVDDDGLGDIDDDIDGEAFSDSEEQALVQQF